MASPMYAPPIIAPPGPPTAAPAIISGTPAIAPNPVAVKTPPKVWKCRNKRKTIN